MGGPPRDSFITLFNFPSGTYLIGSLLVYLFIYCQFLHENRNLASPVHCLISSSWRSAWYRAGPQELSVEWLNEWRGWAQASPSQPSLLHSGTPAMPFSHYLPLTPFALSSCPKFFSGSPSLARLNQSKPRSHLSLSLAKGFCFALFFFLAISEVPQIVPPHDGKCASSQPASPFPSIRPASTPSPWSR